MHLTLICWALLAVGCAGPKAGLFPAENSKPVYLVHRGMHVALVVRREDVPREVWPAHSAVPSSEFIEVGWGDAEGYRLDWTFRIVTRALLWPTPSVMFMHGIDEPLTEYFGGWAREMIKVDLSAEGFTRMCAYFQDTLELNEAGEPIPLGGGFYAATGRYHGFRNSNRWAAGALHAGGCPVRPRFVLTAGGVMRQARSFGEAIHRR